MVARQLSGATIARLTAAGLAITSVGVYFAMGLPMALLFAAGSFLVGVVFLFWNSVQSLTGETELTLEEAVSLGAPSQEEERKRSVLRALKDLEHERSVGKINEEDFVELSARYRVEAKALLQTLDRELAPARRRAEAELADRLEQLKSETTDKPKKKRKKRKAAPPSGTQSKTAREEAQAGDQVPGSGDRAADVSASGDEAQAKATGDEDETASGRRCESCKTPNDTDARFCKGCGTALEATG
jgi:hypothetical protein